MLFTFQALSENGLNAAPLISHTTKKDLCGLGKGSEVKDTRCSSSLEMLTELSQQLELDTGSKTPSGLSLRNQENGKPKELTLESLKLETTLLSPPSMEQDTWFHNSDQLKGIISSKILSLDKLSE